MPVVAFRWRAEITERALCLKGQQRLMQTLLNAKGWIVPNYNLLNALEDIELFRAVVREELNVDQLVHDILSIAKNFLQEGTTAKVSVSFPLRMPAPGLPCENKVISILLVHCKASKPINAVLASSADWFTRYVGVLSVFTMQ